MKLKTEIDGVDEGTWNQLLMQFDDASLRQTWSYGASAGGARGASHIVIKSGENILGCCQVVLRRLPVWKIGIADINWGPVCIMKVRSLEPEVLVGLMRGIKEEYAIKRGYLLKIAPHATGEKKKLLKQILERENFRRDVSERPYRSLRIDLSASIDDLRSNLSRGWRRCLKEAEKNELTLIEGTNMELFDTLVKLAKKVEKIKKFKDFTNYEFQRRVQAGLPDALKLRFVVCEAEGEPVCAAGYSVIGETGFYVLAGTGEKAYGLKATHLAQWRMILGAKAKGVRYFDLGPFNPELNPGVYHFKLGIAGKNGWEETFLGEYYGYFNFSGRVSKLILDLYRQIRKIAR